MAYVMSDVTLVSQLRYKYLTLGLGHLWEREIFDIVYAFDCKILDIFYVVRTSNQQGRCSNYKKQRVIILKTKEEAVSSSLKEHKKLQMHPTNGG